MISSLRQKFGSVLAAHSSFQNVPVLRFHSCFSKPVATGTNNRRFSLLEPKSSLISQVCGFKVKAQLRRRCKDCYIAVRDRRTYVICPTHRRHKQMSMVKKEKFNWILTSASQGKNRPW
ncbi:hypothetical protein AAG570_013384 [Ranatra chinensis]|uniref:Ribosomal protein n=1 Tax=Ranatra chinensis TaxID=642074 RepID=A0ABD0YC04_9HEMI